MRNFERIDETALRAFYFAADSLNFTKAAEAAGLTQSGVSQHIAKLEEALGVSLFLRAGRKVMLTSAGQRLLRYSEQYLDQVDELLADLSNESQVTAGRVSYAMPESCLMTPHFPILLEDRKEFSKVQLKVTICHTPEVIELVLGGDVDFGFVTSQMAHRDLRYEKFAEEDYAMVGAEPLNIRRLDELKSVAFVNYPGMDVLFEKWQKTNFPKAKALKLSDLTFAGEIDNLRAAITMAKYGVGIGVFPSHCIATELADGELHSFRSKPGKNPIYIVSLANRRQPIRVERVLSSFWAMVKS